jgi:hypothetical protein
MTARADEVAAVLPGDRIVPDDARALLAPRLTCASAGRSWSAPRTRAHASTSASASPGCAGVWLVRTVR